MALPLATGAPGFTNLNLGCIGPYLYSGNVYFVTAAAPGNSISVWKATDPTTSFTEQDSTNNPQQASIGGNAIDTKFDGTYIHLFWQNNPVSGPSYRYARFDCSSDAWVDASTYGGTASTYWREIYTTTDRTSQVYHLGIALRSDGDIIMAHPGENPTTMGGTYQEVYYSRLEGTSLTAGVTVASTATKDDNYIHPYVVMGSSDQCHIAYIRDTDGDFYLRALDSSNNLRTQRTQTGTFEAVQHGINFTRSSTEKIAFLVYDTASTTKYRVYFTHFTDDSSPTFTTETITTSEKTEDAGTTNIVYDSLATNVDNYVAYSNSSNDDIYLVGDDGGTSWSDQNGSTAIRGSITCNGITSNIFTRDGNRVFAFCYVDATTHYYDEFILYGVGGGIVFTRRPMRFLSRSF